MLVGIREHGISSLLSTGVAGDECGVSAECGGGEGCLLMWGWQHMGCHRRQASDDSSVQSEQLQRKLSAVEKETDVRQWGLGCKTGILMSN